MSANEPVSVRCRVLQRHAVAEAHAEVVRGFACEDDPRFGRPTGAFDGGCPHCVVEVDDLNEEIKILLVIAGDRRGRKAQTGVGCTDCGCVGDRCDHVGVDRVERVELHEDAVGVAFGEFVAGLVDRTGEAVEHAEHGNECRDCCADADGGQDGTAGGAQEVADWHLGQARPGQLPTSCQVSEPARLGGEVAGSYRFDRFDTNGAPYRDRTGNDRDQQCKECCLREDAELEWGAIDRERSD